MLISAALHYFFKSTSGTVKITFDRTADDKSFLQNFSRSLRIRAFKTLNYPYEFLLQLFFRKFNPSQNV